MFDERKPNIREFSSAEELVSEFNSNREQFSDTQKFPDRLSILTKAENPTLKKDGFGRMVKVTAGGETFIVPHPAIVVNDVSYDSLGNLYECEGFTPNEEQRCENYTLVNPAKLSSGEVLQLVRKGLLIVKR